MKKQHYETPTTDVLVVRFEDSILQTVSDPNRTRSNSASNGYDSGYDLDELL